MTVLEGDLPLVPNRAFSLSPSYGRRERGRDREREGERDCSDTWSSKTLHESDQPAVVGLGLTGVFPNPLILDPLSEL